MDITAFKVAELITWWKCSRLMFGDSNNDVFPRAASQETRCSRLGQGALPLEKEPVIMIQSGRGEKSHTICLDIIVDFLVRSSSQIRRPPRRGCCDGTSHDLSLGEETFDSWSNISCQDGPAVQIQ